MSVKIDKYEFLAEKEIIPCDQWRIIEQATFFYFILGKTFGKQTKTIKGEGGKQIDAITNQKERLAAVTNKDDHKYNYKDLFKEIEKERFDEIKELIDEINQDDLTY